MDNTAMTINNALESALRYAGKGKPIFPCGKDKKPLTTHGFHDATTNPKQIIAWWEQYPDALIGMPTGAESGFTILDVDIDPTKALDGADTLHQLEQQHGKLPDTPEALTPRGGQHKYFNYVPGIRNSAGKLGPGLDIRGEGGYVIVPPSVTDKGAYEWEGSNPPTFADMPAWMVDMLRTPQAPPSGQVTQDATIVEGGRNAHMASLAGSMRRRGMSIEAMEAALLAENTARCEPPLEDDEVRTIAHSVGRYDPVTYQNKKVVQFPTASESETEIKPPADWRALLLCKDDELTPKPKSLSNACVFLAWHPDMRGLFAANQFTGASDIMRPPSWNTPGNPVPRGITDVDITHAGNWLEHHGLTPAPSTVFAAIQAAADIHKYDPLTDWLNSLTWDGNPRLTGWLARLFGAEASRYTDIVGRKFLIGAVARGLSPGCKMDTMLVLEGAQGIKKSTAVAILFGASWFTDEIHSIGSKDAAMQLQGRWGVEIPEMHAMSRAETNQIKEWISRTADKYRPPYGKTVIEVPRRCVMVGTLNPDVGYLKDATGARRFWPVRCFKVDLDAIQEERDQLFAEAVAAYQAGETWWLESEEDINLAREHQEERYESDPWADAIDGYVNGKHSVSTSDIMAHALGMLAKECNRSTETRVGKYLASRGWVRKRISVPGSAVRKWVYQLYT